MMTSNVELPRSKAVSIKANIVSTLSSAAVMSPFRETAEKLLTTAGHQFPTSRIVQSFCRHFGSKLMEREGESFERIVTFASGGQMYCGVDGQIALLNLMHYFIGTITGQTEDERPIVGLLNHLMRTGDVFFDVGANFGFYSCYVSPLCGRSGSIHAFEANPCLIPHLSRSLDLNRTRSNIQLNAIAVGRQSNTVLPLYGPERIGSSSLHAHGWLNRDAAVLVPVTTLDDYVKKHEIRRIDVMKIDIEGAELDAFQGMEDTFRLCPPGVIICEMIPMEVLGRAQSSPAPSMMAEFLREKGYGMFHVVEAKGKLGLRDVSVSAVEDGTAATNVAFALPETRRQRPEVFLD
jgi:FkbM family methyltransferase